MPESCVNVSLTFILFMLFYLLYHKEIVKGLPQQRVAICPHAGQVSFVSQASRENLCIWSCLLMVIILYSVVRS